MRNVGRVSGTYFDKQPLKHSALTNLSSFTALLHIAVNRFLYLMLEEKQGRPGTEASGNGTVDRMQLGTHSVEYRGCHCHGV